MKRKKILIIVVAVIVVTIGTYFGVYSHREPSGPVLWKWNGQEIYCVGGGPTPPHIEEGYGLYGSEFRFAGAYAGASGTIPLIVLNGKECDRTIAIFVVQPSLDKLVEGYKPLPYECFYWITTPNSVVNMTAGENLYIPMTLTIPIDATYENANFQVGIFIKDIEQTGFTQIGYTQWWYIDIT